MLRSIPLAMPLVDSGVRLHGLPRQAVHKQGSVPRKILVVDDLLLNRQILSRMCIKLGFDVLEAEDGQQCLEIVERERSSLCCVFLDLQMPVMNGWETAKRLRASEQELCLPRLPIVACTATQQDELCQGETAFFKAFASGVDDYVAKPLSMPCLEQVLAQHVAVMQLPATLELAPAHCSMEVSMSEHRSALRLREQVAALMQLGS